MPTHSWEDNEPIFGTWYGLLSPKKLTTFPKPFHHDVQHNLMVLPSSATSEKEKHPGIRSILPKAMNSVN
uniref:Uncharacterized protein n=1 Tax=Caenorhabditis japonica TaxID=281687 RepID=A0A8R1ENP2_CAEJA